MRHFVYLSEPKIEMLYAQLPGTESAGGSVEFGFDRKFFKALLKKSFAPKHLIKKADAVCKTLEKDGLIGTIDNPREYFRGELPMLWGPLIEQSNADGKYLVLFVGEWQGDSLTTVCLGGSIANVVGTTDNPDARKKGGFSTHYRIRQMLVESVKLPGDEDAGDETIGLAIRALPDSLRIAGRTYQDYLKFVAQTLFIDVKNEQRAILGTPIFVEYKVRGRDSEY